MKHILVDTNFYVAFKRKQPSAVDLLRQVEYIGISTVVLGELLAGFRYGSREAENRRELDQFLDSPRVEILNIDEETADFYAEVFRALKDKGRKDKGRPIPSNDLWIAATTLRHGLALATFDEHFQSIDGLLLTRS
jgi:predicted nucleic acid-binding protein